jgi:hypothetical protein
MEKNSLYNYYQHAVLPQFGIKDTEVNWTNSRRVEADEFVHYFFASSDAFALIFEDYDGLGRNDSFIREHILDDYKGYEFVEPHSATDSAPTYDGFRLPAPSQYCENVTGNFTLLKLLS